MLATWWKGHAWEAVPAGILPALGVVATRQDGFPLCAAFLYMSNSNGVCWMEWLVSNPEVKGLEIIRGINAIVGFLAEEGKRLGYGVMLTACRQESLVRVYERAGFEVTDQKVTHMLKIIGGQ